MRLAPSATLSSGSSARAHSAFFSTAPLRLPSTVSRRTTAATGTLSTS